MAVPTTPGTTLELEELAREAYYGQYGGNATTYPITGPIHLYDLINGGNSAGSGMSYPVINQTCLPNPASRSSLQLTALVQGMGGGSSTYYYNAYFGVASNIFVGMQLFTNTTLTSLASADTYSQTGTSATTTFCSGGSMGTIGVGSNGLITSLECEPL